MERVKFLQLNSPVVIIVHLHVIFNLFIYLRNHLLMSDFCYVLHLLLLVFISFT